MTRLSDKLFIIFNMVALISGCMAIGSYIYFQMNGVTDCKNVVQKPLIVMGIAVAAISVLGLIGILMKLTSVLWLYSVVALSTLMVLTAFSVFIYTMGNTNGSSLGFKKHNIGVGEHYSEWLKNMVESGKNWKGIRTCLIHNQVCNRIRDNNLFQHVSHFHLVQYISPIENGCCKPPTECGYIYKNGTTWIVPKAGVRRIKESDCKTWSNDENKLCYNCKTCKGGVLEESRMTWILFSLLDFFDITILIIMFTLSCCTRFHILSDSKYRKLQRISP